MRDRVVAVGLQRSPDEPALLAHPELRAALARDPYAYFRFVNLAFAREVCARFADLMPLLPTVNLHGDAHLGQYAITDVGYGLSDFDDACSGPAVLDLVRMGASIELACRLRSWPGESERLLRRFLQGYRLALVDPRAQAPQPRFVQEVMAGFGRDRRPFLEWTQSILEPMEPEEEREILEGFDRYRDLVLARDPTLSPPFFDLRAFGRIRIGVGSALDRKYLLRVQGPSADEADDVVLEIRQVRDLGSIPCVQTAPGAFRIMLGYSRIGDVPFDFMAPIPPAPGQSPQAAQFWVHSWQAHYHELDVIEDGFSPDDLAEIVYDIGVKLGEGHTAEIADPHRFALQRIELDACNRLGDRWIEASRAMADAVVRAWENYARRWED